ncbi:hypothetical protein PYCCODRAFT_1430485 [Trametes coccinea BRFM310]|uniref:RING-type domain-containing protein n=1 Tax=Trametes coccinea (strain BRFM310) TaxID=1353009 RepID=A0A1Y2J2X9_TRAC3|nr:hypothetical protein PYCCODRAFT_1430485 [Trametes coccinea BRFM310]
MSSRTLPRRRSASDFHMLRNHPEAAAAARSDLIQMLEQTHQREARLSDFVNALPRLTERDLTALGHSDSTCPICLNSLLALLAEEEMALVMESPAHPVEGLGVTRLAQTCGHIFCRKDIREWVLQGKTTCPTCRRAFITPSPEDIRAAEQARGAQELTSLLDSVELEGALLEGYMFSLAQSMRPAGPSEGAAGRSARPDDGEARLPEEHFEYDEDRSEFSGMYS